MLSYNELDDYRYELLMLNRRTKNKKLELGERIECMIRLKEMFHELKSVGVDVDNFVNGSFEQ